MGELKLSILICHIPARCWMLDELLSILEPQRCPEVEIIVDGQGGTIGEKRNRLLTQAQGEYVAYVDDDDSVSKSYVSRIITGTSTCPDCLSLVGYYFDSKKYIGMFRHSIDYETWEEATEGPYRWHRPPNHLNPVRRELAMQVMFPEINAGEDRDYSTRLRPLLQTEYDIKAPLYLYCHRDASDHDIIVR